MLYTSVTHVQIQKAALVISVNPAPAPSHRTQSTCMPRAAQHCNISVVLNSTQQITGIDKNLLRTEVMYTGLTEEWKLRLKHQPESPGSRFVLAAEHVSISTRYSSLRVN